MSVSSDTTCTDAGTAASDFLLDYISECGDCNKIETMTLNEKAQLCSRLKESLCFVQKSSLEQEKEEANERANEVFNKCDVCKLVSDSRQRKQAEIRQIYLQVLDKKPAELLCTPGIFSRLETMASKGLFDAVVAEGQRCSKCRQVSANQMENLTCLQNMNEKLSGLQNICQKLDSLQTEIKNSNSSPLSDDENIRTPLNLPPFSGEAWQSPRLAIRMWQKNLKKSGTVKEEWCGLVCEALEGKAKDWCTEQDLTDLTWEQFTQLFVAHFDRDMKRVVSEYLKSVLANDEGELITEPRGRYYRKSNSNGQTFNRNYEHCSFFNFSWMATNDIERFLLACLRAMDDNLKHLLSLFNAQFSLNNYKVQNFNTVTAIAVEPKLNPVTTFTELIMVLQKHEPDNNNADSNKYYKEMKSVANTVIQNTCSASFMLDQLY